MQRGRHRPFPSRPDQSRSGAGAPASGDHAGLLNRLKEIGTLPPEGDDAAKRQAVLGYLFVGASLGEHFAGISYDPNEAWSFIWSYLGELETEGDEWSTLTQSELMDRYRTLDREAFIVWLDRWSAGEAE